MFTVTVLRLCRDMVVAMLLIHVSKGLASSFVPAAVATADSPLDEALQ